MNDSAEMFKKLTQARQQKEKNNLASEQERSSSKKRGRKATGKRSHPDWIGRTYYIRKDTDLDIKDELLKLRRAGIDLDKSELGDFLLNAWLKWRKGENIDFCMSEISPKRKDKKL